jgi:hypothetical protein|tara:strand:+ start:34 stop:402 length:369 start_codon:yes stop_codon:yes gene_type:complete
MTLFDEITSKNFELFAAKHYRNNRCVDLTDFYDDINRFSYLLRLLRKYKDSNKINIRLVLNHIITLYNVFDIEAANRMLRYKIDDDLHDPLNSFLMFLNYLPAQEQRCANMDLSIAKQLQDI